MSQAPSTQTPAAPAEAPYWDQQNASAQPAKPGAMKDLESDDGLTRGQWQVGFWDCFTTLMPNCFMVTFCSCVSVAQISARLGITTYSKALIACLAIIIAEFVISGIASSAASSSYTVETDYTNDGKAYTYTTSSGSGVGVIVYRGVMIMVHVIFALFVMHLRTKTRERFQIPGNSRNDFFAGFAAPVALSLKLRPTSRVTRPEAVNSARWRIHCLLTLSRLPTVLQPVGIEDRESIHFVLSIMKF